MRFMMIMKGDPPTDASRDQEFVGQIVSAMRAYDADLRKAGVLIATEGLYPSWKSKGIRFAAGEPPRVVDGPFAEAKEVVAGFYIIDVASEEEAIEWAKRCPIDVALGPGMETIFEVRQVADVPSEDMTSELASEIIGGTIS